MYLYCAYFLAYVTYYHLIRVVNDGLNPVSQVLTFDCSSIHWITPVYGFLGSTNK